MAREIFSRVPEAKKQFWEGELWSKAYYAQFSQIKLSGFWGSLYLYIQIRGAPLRTSPCYCPETEKRIIDIVVYMCLLLRHV